MGSVEKRSIDCLLSETQVLMSKQLHVEDEETNDPTCVSKSTSNAFDLPIELTVEILSRLPVKSLLRFSAVCKIWKSNIESPNFIFKHLKQYPLNPNLTSSCRGFFDYWDEFTAKIKEVRFHFPDVNYNKYGIIDCFRIVGVCDGLLCVSLSNNESDLVICNPATRQFTKIPPYEQSYINGVAYRWVICRFGLCPQKNLAGDDYMLIRISSGKVVHQAQIYSMSSNDWRVIDLNMPFGSEIMIEEYTGEPLLINGVLYWIAYILEYPYDRVIVSFNVNDDRLQLVVLPICCQTTQVDLIDLKEELAMIRETRDERSLILDYIYHVWVLNAVTCCWSMKFKVKLSPEFGNNIICFIGSMKNGDLIFKNGRIEIYSYDPIAKETKRWSSQDNNYIQNFFYVESLLPVKEKDETLSMKLKCS